MATYREAESLIRQLKPIINQEIENHPLIKSAIKVQKAVVWEAPDTEHHTVAVKFLPDLFNDEISASTFPYNSSLPVSDLTKGKVVFVFYYQSLSNGIVMLNATWSAGGTGGGGSGGAVDSVNGMTGNVILTASDLGIAEWAQEKEKPSYTWNEIIDKPTIPVIPDIIITDSGSGNAVTGIAANGHTITVIKGETFAKNADLTALSGRVTTIEGKIPAQASATNQLADRAFVNSTVQTATANFRGNWETWGDVPSSADNYPIDYAGSKTPTVNDYLVVRDMRGYLSFTGTWRFKYTGTWATNGKGGWQPEYQVNETPLTSVQLAALNSGITAAGVAQISTNKNDIASLKTKNDE